MFNQLVITFSQHLDICTLHGKVVCYTSKKTATAYPLKTQILQNKRPFPETTAHEMETAVINLPRNIKSYDCIRGLSLIPQIRHTCQIVTYFNIKQPGEDVCIQLWVGVVLNLAIVYRSNTLYDFFGSRIDLQTCSHCDGNGRLINFYLPFITS